VIIGGGRDGEKPVSGYGWKRAGLDEWVDEGRITSLKGTISLGLYNKTWPIQGPLWPLSGLILKFGYRVRGFIVAWGEPLGKACWQSRNKARTIEFSSVDDESRLDGKINVMAQVSGVMQCSDPDS
jgi:hypothetical protein